MVETNHEDLIDQIGDMNASLHRTNGKLIYLIIDFFICIFYIHLIRP